MSTSIRSVCTFHFATWMTSDLSSNLKDEHLKYIGWLLSDRSEDVRLSATHAIERILQTVCPSGSAKLKNFVDRFHDRIFEICLEDSDEKIQAAMLEVAKLLQRYSFISRNGIVSCFV